MIRKFFEGIVFGAGFTVSAFAISFVATSFLSHYSTVSSVPVSTGFPAEASRVERKTNQYIDISDMSIDEKIENSSVIALARYEDGEGGIKKAVIREFLKKSEGTTVYYDVGDEYKDSSYHQKDGVTYGDGLIIFFFGSPAEMRYSISYSGERISGLADIPLEIFREKCK